MASGTAQNGPYSAQCAQWDEILLKVELGSNNAPISRDINSDFKDMMSLKND